MQALISPRVQMTVVDIAAFAITAGEFRDRAVKAFPGAEITFQPNPRRQGIVDSWPEDVDDTLARTEWSWKPDYDGCLLRRLLPPGDPEEIREMILPLLSRSCTTGVACALHI